MNKQKFAKITKISNFLEIMKLIKQANQDSLFLFDIDDVVIMDQDEYRLTHPYRQEWVIDGKKRLTKEQREILFSIIFEKRNIRLVDPMIDDILNELWIRAIPTMALTKLYTRKFGVINDFTDWRIKELNKINIDFRLSSPIKEEILIEGEQIGHHTPLIKEGVILTANIDKGQILENLLHKTKYYPKNIIFVDDILENLQAVEKICNRLGINYYGFEFNGASLVPEAHLDQESEKIRFKILEEEHRWLTDLKLHSSDLC